MRLTGGDPTAKNYVAYCNGIRVADCVAADTVEGWVEYILRDEKNKVVCTPWVKVGAGQHREIIKLKAYGHVELKPHPDIIAKFEAEATRLQDASYEPIALSELDKLLLSYLGDK